MPSIAWIWRWRWVLGLNLYLLAPIFAFELRLGRGGPDKTLAFVLPASVLWLLVVQLLVRRPRAAHLILFPFYITVAADLYVIANYHTRLSSSMLLTIFENLEDTGGYVESQGVGMALELAAVLAGYGFGLSRIGRLRVNLPRAAALVPLAAVGLLYGGARHLAGEWTYVVVNDRDSPFGIVPQAMVSEDAFRAANADARAAQGFTFHAVRPVVPDGLETYVLVIGESSRPMNWQLYGYSRETSPRLASLQNLLVFRDVITQAAETRVSVPLMITRGSIEDLQRTATEKSVVSAYREAGFRTYWLSTQQRDPYTGAINRYPREADVDRFFDRAQDSVLVDTVEQVLQQDGARYPKLFLVVHTLGSHFTLTSRYPRSFDVFPDDDPGLDAHQRLINAYDNTILYTDRILSDLIETIAKRPGPKALLYVADHGENLRDDDRALFGHDHHNEYDLPIPMLLWYSPEYEAHFPERIAAARSHVGAPLNTRVVFHSLVDLAGIDVHDPDTATMSVLRPELSRFHRMVMGEPRCFDFDAWLASQHLQQPSSSPALSDGQPGALDVRKLVRVQ